MCAAIMYGPGDVRVENVPDAKILEPTDALVVATRAASCGSDLLPCRGYAEFGETGNRMGHEFIGIVEAAGSELRTLKKDKLVAAPFAISGGTRVFYHAGLHTCCVHGSWCAWATISICTASTGEREPDSAACSHGLQSASGRAVWSTSHLSKNLKLAKVNGFSETEPAEVMTYLDFNTG